MIDIEDVIYMPITDSLSHYIRFAKFFNASEDLMSGLDGLNVSRSRLIDPTKNIFQLRVHGGLFWPD